MKSVLCCLLPLMFLATAAHAASYDDGLRYKREQKLEQAAAAFTDVVSRDPGNLLALEQLAIVQGWLNRYDASVASWRKAIALAPKKPDYHVGLARVLYWKKDRAEALRELEIALKLAPRDADALILKGDVLMADGRPSEARAAYVQAQTLRGGDDEALERKIAGAVAPKSWRLDAGYIADSYDAVRNNENSSYLQLGYALSPATTIYARLDRYFSFEAVDGGVSIGGYFLTAPWLLLNAEIGTTPGTVDFRSDETATLNAEILLDGPVQPLLGVRFLRYEQGDVTTVTPGLRLLFAPATLELRYGYSNNTDDSKTGVVQARLSFDLDRYAPYLAYASGEEALPPLAKADITVLGAGCVFNLSPSWGARLDYSREDRKDTYIHDAVGVGLTYKF